MAVEPEKTWVRVASLADLSRKGRMVRVGRKEIALFRAGDRVYAVSNVCPHAGGPLADGYFVDGPAVECPWHYWGFRLDDGRCTHFPDARVENYQVRVEDGEVSILV